jgi:hypothetical protein
MSLEHLQRHTADRPIELPESAKALRGDLLRTLIKASNAKKITTPPQDIQAYLQLHPEPPPRVLKELRAMDLHRDAFCITGGEKNQDRVESLAHFKRDDGAWFDFSIVVRQTGGRIDLLAYDFEIRLAPLMGAPFLRFDLNLPDHRNEGRDLRCHLHPGSDEILVPAPLMSPSELLTLFIEGARLSTDRERRNPTDFDVSWLQRSLQHPLAAAIASRGTDPI